ncbi:MAG TPA: hypothetical protein VF788_03510 [Pseudonocardiaceae bacterium]
MNHRTRLRDALGTDQIRRGGRGLSGRVDPVSLSSATGSTRASRDGAQQRGIVARECALTNVRRADQHRTAGQQGPRRKATGSADKERPATAQLAARQTAGHLTD